VIPTSFTLDVEMITAVVLLMNSTGKCQDGTVFQEACCSNEALRKFVFCSKRMKKTFKHDDKNVLCTTSLFMLVFTK
jgi:hypothetical protein